MCCGVFVKAASAILEWSSILQQCVCYFVITAVMVMCDQWLEMAAVVLFVLAENAGYEAVCSDLTYNFECLQLCDKMVITYY